MMGNKATNLHHSGVGKVNLENKSLTLPKQQLFLCGKTAEKTEKMSPFQQL